ncbi:MFS transporter [Candidatus Neptunichlamydia sp. REUL1]|uniref:MFS transporter n=1 Tax=Candidatus Neptunichlamydia sp. REUL1 TaxID=3064277 RepID=UPI00292E3DB6|nr:MFS transporter [Candidatus Neptunochlamydia sp. REUL1]
MGFGVIASSLSILLIGHALSGLMTGSQPIAQAAISDLSTSETKALNMSMITFVICIGLVLGPLLGGIFSDPNLFAGFGFDTPFFIAAALYGIAALWILISFKKTFVPTKKKPLSLFHPIEVFIDAFRHREVRALVIIFLLI